MTTLTGKSLGRYHILDQLGEGGMAIVYKAYDTRLESEVAVKVIRTENLAPSILERALKRFEREAKALAKLNHPNIVNILDYGEFEGKPYLVMPYLPSGTLKQKLLGKPIPVQEAMRLILPIARALAYAHQQGTIHRDVKPSNILITQSGEPMLTDFGIAKIIDDDITQDLTGTNTTIGTPEYMAPEQVTSKTVDHRADIYSLGIVLYEMVTGRKPYRADTPLAVMLKHASEPLPRPTKFVPGLPDSLEKILFKALAKKVGERYQNMNEVIAAIETTLSRANTRPASSAKKWIGCFAGGLVLIAMLAASAVGIILWNSNASQISVAKAEQTRSALQVKNLYLTMTASVPSKAPSTTIIIPSPTTRPSSVPTNAPTLQASVKSSRIQSREGPDLRFKSMGNYQRGATCTLISQFRGWYYVKFPDGEGWVYKDWLEIPPNIDVSKVPEISYNDLPFNIRKYFPK